MVVGIDGSPGSRAALAYALRDAARRGVAVEAVAASTPPDYPGYETWAPLYGPIPVPVDQMRDEVRRAAAERTVQEVTGELAAETTVPPVTVRVADGGAADALLYAAGGADLLEYTTMQRLEANLANRWRPPADGAWPRTSQSEAAAGSVGASL